MELLVYGGFTAGVIYLAYALMNRAKADKVVAELVVRPSAQESAELTEIAKLEQEIKDGKIDYAAARARLNELRKRADSATGGTPGV